MAHYNKSTSSDIIMLIKHEYKQIIIAQFLQFSSKAVTMLLVYSLAPCWLTIIGRYKSAPASATTASKALTCWTSDD
jgi:hypothetical protein